MVEKVENIRCGGQSFHGGKFKVQRMMRSQLCQRWLGGGSVWNGGEAGPLEEGREDGAGHSEPAKVPGPSLSLSTRKQLPG